MPAGALESPSIPTLRPPAGERAHRMADFGTDEVVLKSLIDTANKPDALPLMAIASWINAFTAFKRCCCKLTRSRLICPCSGWTGEIFWPALKKSRKTI
jgi:hypothetical protein